MWPLKWTGRNTLFINLTFYLQGYKWIMMQKLTLLNLNWRGFWLSVTWWSLINTDGDSSRAKPFPLAAFIADDELWMTFFLHENVSMSSRKVKKSDFDAILWTLIGLCICHTLIFSPTMLSVMHWNAYANSLCVKTYQVIHLSLI